MPATPTTSAPPHVLILGAGVNGACVARELLLNGIAVTIVDRFDIAAGATSKSSRLIHGGVRYLEYGDVSLVRESLAERARLLQLAPHFVRPLRLFIPVARRTGGMWQAALRFLKLTRFGRGRRLSGKRGHAAERGLWTLRLGLWLYDRIRRDDLPKYAVHRRADNTGPAVDPARFRWLLSYSDAQMLYPERFVIALLEDCCSIARENGTPFELLTHHRAGFQKDGIAIWPTEQPEPGNNDRLLKPAAIVNATGAWGDLTLQQLPADFAPLFGGTKGSHIITRQPALRESIGENAVYAEAADGRLVFILPFGEAVLVGTTDRRYEGPPDEAHASEEEIAYLIDLVTQLMPHVALSRDDVDAHYCGVRPLPIQPEGKPGSIPRGHWIDMHLKDALPIYTLIGGKLTTCRALGEEAAGRVLSGLWLTRKADTRTRLVPGAEHCPTEESALANWMHRVARDAGYAPQQVRALWPLLGTRTSPVLNSLRDGEHAIVPGTLFPVAFIDWVIRHEWATRLDDLVERRLMLAWHPDLSVETLLVLADRLVQAGHLDAHDREATVATTLTRLQKHYGRTLQQPATVTRDALR